MALGRWVIFLGMLLTVLLAYHLDELDLYALGGGLLGLLLLLLVGWCIKKLFKQGVANKLIGLIGLGVCVALSWLNVDLFKLTIVMMLTRLPYYLLGN